MGNCYSLKIPEIFQTEKSTRMHSNRMHTTSSLPYSGGSVQGVSVQVGSLSRGSLSRGSLSRGSLSGRPPRQRPPPPMNRMTDTHLWKHYLTLNFVCGQSQENVSSSLDQKYGDIKKYLSSHLLYCNARAAMLIPLLLA